MAKKRGGKGVPGRREAERQRRELEAKQRQLRAAVARVRALLPHENPDPEAQAAAFRELRRLALSPLGFADDTFRADLWLFLAGRADFEPHALHSAGHFATRYGAPHRDDAQVEKDIDRSLWCV